MRKAHEAEAQREIARFKEEFLAQMSSSSSTTSSSSSSRNTNGSNPADREREIEEIRHEILSLSEKYSHKCLETAALEQKVSSLSQQVSVSHRQIGDLDARNQQLRSFLESNLNQDQTELNPAQQLRAKDSQLLMLQEDGNKMFLNFSPKCGILGSGAHYISGIPGSGKGKTMPFN